MQGGSSAVAAESQNLVQINSEEEFNAKIASAKGVAVVDFYADWCPPCKALAPIFAKTADAYAGKAAFYKLNIDKNQALSKKFNIEGIPCVVLFKDGKEASRVVGLVGEAKYKEEIDKLLK
jgi:thioredoxin 1